MNAEDFRRTALSFEGAEAGSHIGAEDFRVGGRIFATLASVDQGYGNLMLTPEQQAEFVQDAPEILSRCAEDGAETALRILSSIWQTRPHWKVR